MMSSLVATRLDQNATGMARTRYAASAYRFAVVSMISVRVKKGIKSAFSFLFAQPQFFVCVRFPWFFDIGLLRRKGHVYHLAVNATIE